ncbi:polyprenyl synthetase family protein [Streptomyces sp. NPDC048290]|uniref:polyprenyl synthetase family protein n=1 Tax=Streptomyces sp. NPDC048290 TaxID=3155811 RepID=UPI00341EBD25
MRSTPAPGLPTADPPHRPSADPAGPGGDGPVEASAVDADVPAAVGRELRALLAVRLVGCRELDPVFARDIAERVAHFAGRGGRRIRPRLLWWSLRACGGEDAPRVRAALRTAAALELVQTCALVHDDLMDRAPVRRRGPALHADLTAQYTGAALPPAAERLGTSGALLAGDTALAWADDVLTDVLLDGGLPDRTVARLRGVWRALRTEMAAGQYLDVQGQATADRTLTRATRAAELKSARYTVERPLELGAVLAGADAVTTAALCRAGRAAGLAFQLRDDLDDLFADPGSTGKPSGGDIREGKPTSLLAMARALAAAGDRDALGVLDRSTGRADLTPAQLADVRAAVVATGAPGLIRARIARLTAQSLRHLDAATLHPVPAARLRALLDEITATPDTSTEAAR